MMEIIVVEVSIRNRRSYTVTKRLPQGSIIEISNPKSSAQHAMAVRDYVITIPPNKVATVYIEAMCFIKRRSWPINSPGNLTPYKFSGPYRGQEDLWQQLGY